MSVSPSFLSPLSIQSDLNPGGSAFKCIQNQTPSQPSSPAPAPVPTPAFLAWIMALVSSWSPCSCSYPRVSSAAEVE